MNKKSNVSPAIAVRLNNDDQAEVEFIKKTLSRPGMQVGTTSAIKQAIYAFAEQLRTTKNKHDKSSEQSKA